MSTENDKPDYGDDLPDDAAAAAALAAEEKAEAERLEAEKLAQEKAKNGEDDDEETEEEKAERLAAEEAAAKKAKARFPVSRHEEILNKARQREDALKEQLRVLQNSRTESAQQKTVKDMQAKIDELDDTYEELILDGKKAEAKAARLEARELREQLSEFRSATASAQARAGAIETLRWDAALAKAEQAYPELNPDDTDAYDDAKTTEVADLADALSTSQKIPRYEALEKAVKYVLGAPKAKNSAATGDVADIAKKRAEEARKKAAAANSKQPASNDKAGKDMDKGGGNHGEINVMKLKQDEFAKLDEETIARMRGDVLEA